MKRRIIPPLAILTIVGALLIQPAAAAGTSKQAALAEPFCETHVAACPDTRTHLNYEGDYVGHDEPSVLFYSSQPGSGNSNVWHLRLPHESPTLPTQDGTGGTWNFQQHITFWFGMALCESQSYPTPGTDCTPDSDANIKDGADPSSPDWIGNHVGTGFMELQLYRRHLVRCDAVVRRGRGLRPLGQLDPDEQPGLPAPGRRGVGQLRLPHAFR
jgi:hypothetical protein